MKGPYHFTLLGDPVSHSRSPAIHRAALLSADLEGTYEAITADRPRLVAAVLDLRRGVVHGLNVTMPLKRDAWELADITTDEARRGESVNTMRMSGESVEGHSTDVVAFRTIIAQNFAQIGHVLLLGTGGSAMAAAAAMTGQHVWVSGRDEAKTAELARRVQATPLPWGEAIEGALVINATPLGMSGESLPSGLPDGAAGLIDLPYGRGVTPAIRSAARSGIPAVDGVEFLATQAAASFEWWTGVAVDSKELTEIARNA